MAQPPTADGLGRRYLPALLSVLALIVFNQLVVQPSLVRLTLDAPVINVAGRQRMLSQKLAKTALELDAARMPDELTALQRELTSTATNWERAHTGLEHGDQGLLLPGGNSAPVAAALAELDEDFQPMRDAAKRIDTLLREPGTARPNRGEIHKQVSVITRHEEPFLQKMDAVVGMFEAEAQSHVDSLRRTGWVIMGGIMVVLAAAEFARRQAAERMRRLAEQLAHASRLNTMGEMATGLAHEINQPLGAIANYAEGCLARLQSGESGHAELRTALERISASALRAGEILRRIRQFVRRQEHQCVRVSIGQLIGDVAQLCRPEAERLNVAVRLDTTGQLPEVWADPIQIQQVLVNLIRNGFQALEAQAGDERRLAVTASVNRNHEIEVAVVDSGEGFSPRDAESIFEPFYTTRPDGLGMGLAISRSIVENHGGRLWAESAGNHGATLHFTLPPASPGGSYAR